MLSEGESEDCECSCNLDVDVGEVVGRNPKLKESTAGGQGFRDWLGDRDADEEGAAPRGDGRATAELLVVEEGRRGHRARDRYRER